MKLFLDKPGDLEMPQMWTEEEKNQLREIDSQIATHPSADEMKARANAEREAEYERPGSTTSMNNRELRQAILDTHAMLLKTGAMHHFQSTLEKHYVQLLAVQRHRAGLTDMEQN